jgi:hypothetical protein
VPPSWVGACWLAVRARAATADRSEGCWAHASLTSVRLTPLAGAERAGRCCLAWVTDAAPAALMAPAAAAFQVCRGCSRATRLGLPALVTTPTAAGCRVLAGLARPALRLAAAADGQAGRASPVAALRELVVLPA